MPCPDCGRGIVLGERACPVSDDDHPGWHRHCERCRVCVREQCCPCPRVICSICDPATYHPDADAFRRHEDRTHGAPEEIVEDGG